MGITGMQTVGEIYINYSGDSAFLTLFLKSILIIRIRVNFVSDL